MRDTRPVGDGHAEDVLQHTADVAVDADAAATARVVWVESPGTGPGPAAGALTACAKCVTIG